MIRRIATTGSGILAAATAVLMAATLQAGDGWPRRYREDRPVTNPETGPGKPYYHGFSPGKYGGPAPRFPWLVSEKTYLHYSCYYRRGGMYGPGYGVNPAWRGERAVYGPEYSTIVATGGVGAAIVSPLCPPAPAANAQPMEYAPFAYAPQQATIESAVAVPEDPFGQIPRVPYQH